MSENYYTFSDGRVIEDTALSDLMRKLVKLQPEKSLSYTWDDIGTATLMSDLYADSIRYCPQQDDWYVWNGCWVRQVEDGVISDKLQTMLNLLNLYCKELEHHVDKSNKDAVKALESYKKYIKSTRKLPAMRNILGVLKTMVRLSLTEMDKNPYLLNTPRACYDLRTGKQVKDIDEFNITKKTSCNLPDALTKRCDRWYEFINQIMSGDKEKAKFLQRALGYSMLGVNREECMFVAYGAKTRNGKGTLFSTIDTVLGQDYADSAPTDLICENKNGRTTDFNAPQPVLSKLVGTRLVTMAESAKDVRLDAANMKTLTGRDTLVTRGLFQNSFSFTPQFTLWMNTNHLPAVTDETVFASNRIWVIEFNEQFTGSAQDKDLKEIFADPENRPTILKWLFDGCKDYIENGLNPPECVRTATENYRKMHDRLGNFIEETCDTGDDCKILRGSLYSAYCSWCTKPDNRFRPMGSTSFYNEIAMRGYAVTRFDDGWYVEGLKIHEAPAGKIKI